MSRTTSLAVGLLLLLCRAALADDPLLRKLPGEIPVGPLPFQQIVLGTSLDARASFFLTAKPVDAQVQLTIRGLLDLSDLQRKIGTIIDTIPLPTDSCARVDAANVVVRIWGKQIVADEATATLELHGDLNVWGCFKDPTPCIKWENLQIVLYDCKSPKPVSGVNQPFDAAMPFDLSVADPQTIALLIGKPSITLNGQYSGVTNGILSIAGIDINQSVEGLLDGAIDPNQLRAKLPDYLAVLNPTITSAGFLSDQGNLLASAQMSATIDGNTLLQLIEALLNQQTKTPPTAPASP